MNRQAWYVLAVVVVVGVGVAWWTLGRGEDERVATGPGPLAELAGTRPICLS